MLHFLNDVINDIELTQNSRIMSYLLVCRVNQNCKLINRIPGLCLSDIKFTRLGLENAC